MTIPPHAGPPVLTITEGCATIRLNRSQHMNRLHREDLLALQAHFDTIGSNRDVGALVLTGSGRMFCSGYHIGDLDASDSAASQDPHLFEQTVNALEALAVPTLARLNGSVYGGATDLALACDFRIGVDTLELRMPAAQLGLHYYASGLRRYVTRMGIGPAKRLFMTAQAVGADELRRIGYLDLSVPADRLDAQVLELVQCLLANAPLAVRGMKASLNEIARGDFAAERLHEREALCAGSEDLREGLAAFAAKRVPRFSGH